MLLYNSLNQNIKKMAIYNKININSFQQTKLKIILLKKANIIFTVVLIILFCNIPYIHSEMIADNVLLAINCGGESYKDSKDIHYIEDKYVDSGQSSDFGSQFEIKNTHDQLPYQTERWSENDFTYNLPIPEGKYVLVLKFSEVYFNSPNEKVFDIMIGSKKVVANLDIFNKVGKSTAYDEFVEFEIKAEKAYFKGKAIDGGYDKNKGTLAVTFKKGERDNPKINAIVVVKGTLQDTDYEHFKVQLEDLEREKLEKERKQREIKKRNNLHYDFEEYEEDFVDIDLETKKSMFTNPVFWVSSALIAYILYSLLLKKKAVIEDEKEE